MIVAFFYSGRKIPSYQIKNLLDIRVRFPTIELYFITNNRKKIDYINKFGIKTFFYDFNQSNQSELTKYKINRNLLTNAIARFYGLQALMKKVHVPAILVESDIWIASNFPFNKFEGLNTEMAYPLLCEGSGIASTVYFRDIISVNNFIEYVEKEITSESCSTDMQIMWSYLNKYGSRVLVLPTSINHKKVLNPTNKSEINSKISNNIKVFNGLFDGATWGQFITGEDPKNLLGIQRIYHRLNHHFVNPSNYQIQLNSIGEIKVSISDSNLPLYSLHIHSKDKRYFSKHQDTMIRNRINKISKYEKYEFHLLKGLKGIRKESIINFTKLIKELTLRPFN